MGPHLMEPTDCESTLLQLSLVIPPRRLEKAMKWQLRQVVGAADVIEVLLRNFKGEVEKMHDGLLIRLSLHQKNKVVGGSS